MCDSCKSVLGNCVKKHEQHNCPLQRSKYCTFCSKYGHTSIKCTEDISYRNMVIEESETIFEPYQKYVLDYVDEPKAIRALLKAYGELPQKEERSKEKYKKQLIKMAKKKNLMIVPHRLEKNEVFQLDG